MQNAKIKDISAALLILLWVYTALSKLIAFETFRDQLYNQVFSNTIADILLFLLPTIELIAAALLTIKKTQKAGFLLSAILMLLFTGYIAFILGGYFERIPCSCGGVLQYMGWKTHLVFNLFFTFLSIYGLYSYAKLQQKI